MLDMAAEMDTGLKGSVIYNPLDPTDRVDAVLEFQPGKSLSHYVNDLPGDIEWQIMLNTAVIPAAGLDLTFPKMGDHIIAVPVPEGGGDDGKAILALVATIALSFFAPIAGTKIAAAFFGGSKLAATLAGAAVSIAGGLLINAMIPAPEDGSGTKSNAYGIDGPKNTSSEGVPYPVLYGEHGFGGNLGDLYTINTTDENGEAIQYLYGRVIVSEGPIQSIDTIYINDQPIENYEDVEFDYRLGDAVQDSSPWFENTITLQNDGRELTTNWQTYTTSQAVDKLRIDFVAPAGLGTTDDKGRDVTVTVNIEAEYSPTGQNDWRPIYAVGNWYTPASPADETNGFRIQRTVGTVAEDPGGAQTTPYNETIEYRVTGSSDPWVSMGTKSGTTAGRVSLSWEVSGLPLASYEFRVNGVVTADPGLIWHIGQGPITMSDTRAVTLRRSYHTDLLEQQIYDVRFRRTNAKTLNEGWREDVNCSDIGEILVEPLNLPYVSWLGFKVRVDGQINGLPTITGVAKGRIVPIYDHAGTLVSVSYSRNPADIVLDMYLNSRYGGAIEKERIDFAGFSEWRDFCTDNGLTFDGIYYETSNIDDATKPVFTAGRAQRVTSGARISVAMDRPDTPVMLFSAGNILKNSFALNYLPFQDRINDIEVAYNDKTDKYKRKVVRISNNAALNRGEPLKSATIELKGITDKDRAAKEAQFRMNYNQLVYRTTEWESPIEAISCTVGDVVLVQHEMMDWGIGGRVLPGATINSVKLDREVTFKWGTTYKLLVHHDSKSLVTSATVTSHTGTVVTLNTAVIDDHPSSLVVNGSGDEYLILRKVDDTTFVLDDSSAGQALNLAGAVTVRKHDAIEEVTVVNPSSGADITTDTVTMSAGNEFDQAPGDYVNFIFGASTAVNKPYRVKTLRRIHKTNRVKITAIEYVEAVYSDTPAVPAVTSPTRQFSQHVGNLSAVEQLRIVNGGYVSYVLASWTPGTEIYAGAQVQVSINNSAFRTVETTQNTSAAFQVTEGDAVVVRVVALDFNTGEPLNASGAPSVSLTATGDVTAPEIPSALVATPLVDGYALSWNAQTEADLHHFDIYVANTSTPAPNASTPATHTSLTNTFSRTDVGSGLTRHFWVRAVDAAGNASAWSSRVSTTTLTYETSRPAAAVPTGLNLSSALSENGLSTLSATWNVASGATGYEVGVTASGGSEIVFNVNSTNWSTLSQRGVSYSIRVRSINLFNEPSAWTAAVNITSATDNIPPAVPTGLAVFPGFGTIWAGWDANAEPDFDHYDVYYTTTATVPNAGTAPSLSTPAREISITGWDANQTVNVFVRAVDTSGNKSAWSAKVSGTTPVEEAITAADIEGIVDATSFATGVSPVGVVSSLPADNSDYDVVVLTTNGKLYRWNGSAWTAAVPTTDLSGTITNAQIAAVDAAKITSGVINAARINAVNASAIQGQIIAGQIASAAIDASKFASTVKPIEIVTTLPGAPHVQGRTVLLTTDNKLYRNTGSGWIASVAAGDVSGQLVDAQLAAISSAKLVGQVVSAQIASIDAAKLTGTIEEARLASIAASKVTGQLTNSQIADLAAAKLTGQITAPQIADGAVTDAKIAGLAASKVTGQLSDAQIAAVSAAKMTGQVVAAQIADAAITTAKFASTIKPVEILAALPGTPHVQGRMVLLTTDNKLYRNTGSGWTAATPATDITGTLTSAQIADLDAAKIAGQLSDSQIAGISAAKLVGQVVSGQIATIDSAKLTGTINEARIAGLAASKITGQLSNSQISDLAATKISGQLSDSQIAAISAAKMTGQIVGTQITDNAITTAKIAANAITATQIAAGTITAAEIASNAITATKISAGAITTDKIAARAVTAANLTIADGENLVWNSSFDGDLQEWSPSGNFLYSDTLSKYGAGVARCIETGGVGRVIRNHHHVPCEPGDKFFLSGYVQFSAGYSTASATGCGIRVSWMNEGKTELSTSIVTYKAGGAIDTWHYLEGESPGAPAGAVYARFEFISYGQTGGNSYFDGAYMRRMDAGVLIVDGTLAASKLVANSITSGQIAAGAITAAEIAAGAITAGKVAANAITATEIAAGAITTSKIAANAVTASEIATNAITATQISAGAITTAKIAANAVTANEIASNAITAAKISAGAVTAGKVAANAITATEIAAGAVTTGKVAAGAISTNELAAGAITATKLAVGDFTNLAHGCDMEDAARLPFPLNTGMSLATNYFRTGTQSLAIGSTFAASSYFTNELAVNEGDEIYVEAWVRLSVDYDGDNNHKLRFSNGSDNAHIMSLVYSSAPSVSTWHKLSGTFTVPTGENRIRVSFAKGTTFTTGYVWIDNIVIRQRAKGELIVDGAITADHLTANSVTAAKIATDAVTADKIAANAITAAKIAAGAITAGKIAAGTIVAADIAAGAITAGKIAANAVTATEIASNAITSVKIASGAITTAKLAANAVTANEIAANAITSAKINAGAITTAKLAAGAVTANEIAALAVTAGKVAANAITATEIAANAVTAGKIAANAVTATAIAADAVTADKIAARSVSASKLTISDTENLVWNANFDGDASEWSFSAANAYQTTMRKYGAGGIKCFETGGSSHAIRNKHYVPCEPGDKFYLSGYLYVNAGYSNASGTGVGIRSSWRDINGNEIATSLADSMLTPASGTWHFLEGEVTAPANAITVNFEFFSFSQTGGEVYFDGAYMRRMDAGRLIVDGTLEATKLVANSITGGQIEAGAIGADEIAADSISVKHLTISDFENYAAGSSGQWSDHPWVLSPGASIGTLPAGGGHDLQGGKAMRLDYAANSTKATIPQVIEVSGQDDELYVDFWVYKSNATGGSVGGTKLRFGNADNSSALVDDVEFNSVANGVWTHVTQTIQVDSTVTRLDAKVYTDHTAGYYLLDDITIRRKRGGELVVDGSITGTHIKSATITAANLTIGNRNVDFDGLNFTTSGNTLSWGTGSARYRDNDGVYQYRAISAGSVAYSGSTQFIYWQAGASSLTTSTTSASAVGDYSILVAVYYGGTNFVATKGRTIIDGDYIKTGTIEADHIAAGAITTEKLSVTSAGNLLENSNWIAGTQNAYILGNNDAAMAAECSVKIRKDGSWGATSGGTFEIAQPGTAGTSESSYFIAYLGKVNELTGTGAALHKAKAFDVEEGAWYDLSAQVSTHRCSASMMISWYDSTGAFLSNSTNYVLPTNVSGGLTNWDAWPRYYTKAQAPANARFAAVSFRKYRTVTGASPVNSYVFVHKPMFAKTTAESTEPTPYAPSGTTYITGGEIFTDAITASHIKAGEINTSHMTAGTIDADRLVSNSIEAAQIAAGAIGASEIASDAITAKHLTVTDFTNLAANSAGEWKDHPWNLTSDADIVTLGTGPDGAGGKAMRLKNTGGSIKAYLDHQIGLPNTEDIVANPSATKKLYYSFWVYNNGATGQTSDNTKVRFSNADTAAHIVDVAFHTAPNGQWTQYTGTLEFDKTVNLIDVQIRSNQTAGDFKIDDIVLRRMFGGEMIVTGSIKSNHLVTDTAVITVGAQINNAIITDAHIGNLTAAAISVGALNPLITVGTGGTTIGDVEDRANDPAARINAATTKIEPGKITISGSTTLNDWRATNKTTIDGGKIETDSITAAQIAAGSITASRLTVTDNENLFRGGDFSDRDSTGWVTGGSSWVISWVDGVTGGGALNWSKNTLANSVWVRGGTNSRAPVRAGEKYYAETEARTGGLTATAGFYYRILWYDNTGTALTGGAGSTYTDVVANQGLSSTWTTFTAQITAPTGAAWAEWQIYNHSSNTIVSQFWVDRVVLRRANAGNLIVDGTLSATKLVLDGQTVYNSSGTLKIKPGGVDTNEVAADAITDWAATARSTDFDLNVDKTWTTVITSPSMTFEGGHSVYAFGKLGIISEFTSGGGRFEWLYRIRRNGTVLHQSPRITVHSSGGTYVGVDIGDVVPVDYLGSSEAGTHTWDVQVYFDNTALGGSNGVSGGTPYVQFYVKAGSTFGISEMKR